MNDNQPNKEQAASAPEYIFITDSQYSIDKNGDVYKDGKISICPYAPKVPMAKKVQNISLSQGIDPENYSFYNFPCTLKCPKCNVVAMQNSATTQIEGYALQITCNGTLDQFALPVIAAEVGDSNNGPSGMSVVK